MSPLHLVTLSGCTGSPANPAAATQPATAIDVERARPGYWWNLPAEGTVAARDFDVLWRACERVAVDAGFKWDRQDYRAGVLTTKPLISPTPFELWRADVATLEDRAEAALHTVRRTARFEVRRVGGTGPDDAGAYYEVTPKVLVERYSQVEHRITNVTQYRDVFAMTREESQRERDAARNPGEEVPPTYWYPVYRDAAMERRLTDWVRNQLPESQIVLPAGGPVAAGG